MNQETLLDQLSNMGSMPVELQSDVSDFCQEFNEVLRDYYESVERFHSTYHKWLKVRSEVVLSLTALSDLIDKHHHNVNIASLSGSSVSLLSGGACLAGLALAPFTGGLSVFLTSGGLLGSAAGTLTITGAQIAEIRLKKCACDKASAILEIDGKQTLYLETVIDMCLKYLQKIFHLLHNSNCIEWIQRSDEISSQIITNVSLRDRVERIQDGLGSVEDFLIVLSILMRDSSVFMAANVMKSHNLKPLLLQSTLRIGATLRSSLCNARKCATIIKNWRSGLTAVNVASKASRLAKGALLGISMVVDILELSSVAKDMVSKKQTQESKVLQDVIKEMKKQTDSIKEYYDASASFD